MLKSLEGYRALICGALIAALTYLHMNFDLVNNETIFGGIVTVLTILGGAALNAKANRTKTAPPA